MLEHLTVVTSTMDVARERVASGQVGTPYAGILADMQTQGRGQRGRVWHSPAADNLYATFYLPQPVELAARVSELSFVAGVAAAETLQSVLDGAPQPAQLGLKWPNDLLLNGKKTGGILIELVRAPGGDWVALVGMGVNLGAHAFPPDLAAIATSFLLESGFALERVPLAEALAASLQTWESIRRASGFETVLDRWRAYDVTPGRRYRVETGSGWTHGVAESVDSIGALLVRLESGELLRTASASSVLEVTAAEDR